MVMLMGAICFVIGALAGGIAVWWVLQQRLRDGQTSYQAVEGQFRDAFKALAAETLQATIQQNTEQFLTLANEKLGQQSQQQTQELDGKKALIDQRLATITTEIGTKLEKVTTMVTELEKDRVLKFTQLTTQLGQSAEQVQKLQTTTADLKAALSNSRTRGQWGERMAEDVLRLAGLQRDINYRVQATLGATESGRGRPDYTFLLPDERVIHMDVKFPMDNYLAYLNADTDGARTAAAKQFVADTRMRLKETGSRDYRSATTMQGEQALEYVLVFIPNEQVYAFLLEQAPQVLDEALSQKLILCSPTTLLAVLAVINQSARHFKLQQQAAGIQEILLGIKDQWDKYTGMMGKMGEKLSEAQKAYDQLTGTRTNMLDRAFNKLDALPQDKREGVATPLLAVQADDAVIQ